MPWRKKDKEPPQLTEEYVVAEIQAGKDDRRRLNLITARIYEELGRAWKKRANEHQAPTAFDDAVMALIKKVQESQYMPDNWQGFIMKVGQRRLVDSFNQQTRYSKKYQLTDDLTPFEKGGDAFSELEDKAYLQQLLKDANLNDHQRTALGLIAAGYSYKDMSEKTGRSETNLRKDVSDGMFRLQEYLVGKKKNLRYCRESCNTLVQGQLGGSSFNKIEKANPDLSLKDFPNPCNSWEAQYKTCINCLVKQCREII